MKVPSVPWEKNPRVVLLDGSEEFFKDRLEREARDVFSEYSHVFLWAGIDSDHAIADALYEGSFFSREKLVIVRDANKGPEETLTAYCDDPADDLVVVLASSKGRKPKWWKNLQHDVKVDCSPLKSWDYPDWILHYCTQNGYSLDKKFAESIHTNVGDDLYALSNELSKIFIRTDGTHVGVKDITSVLVSHQTLSPFKVLEAWAGGNRDLALRLATIFFHQSTETHAPLILTKVFMGYVEKMIRFSSYRALQVPERGIKKRMGLNSYTYGPLQHQTSRWNPEQLRRAYRELCELDSASKRGGNGQLLFQWFLTQTFEDTNDF